MTEIHICLALHNLILYMIQQFIYVCTLYIYIIYLILPSYISIQNIHSTGKSTLGFVSTCTYYNMTEHYFHNRLKQYCLVYTYLEIYKFFILLIFYSDKSHYPGKCKSILTDSWKYIYSNHEYIIKNNNIWTIKDIIKKRMTFLQQKYDTNISL